MAASLADRARRRGRPPSGAVAASRPSSSGALARGWPSLVAGATVIALLALLAWRAGGYFPVDHLAAGAVAFVVLAVLLVARPPHYALSGPALVALAALGGLALWTGLSAGWSPTPITAQEDFQRALMYVGLFGLAVLAAGSGRYARHLLWAALALVTAIAAYALASRLMPDVVATPTTTEIAGYRLGHPLGYWNALGALCAMGVVLAAGLAADARAFILARAGAAGAGVVLALAGYLSLSRGAWLALAVGVIVLLVAGPRRISLLASLAVVAGPAALAIARLQDERALTEDPRAAPGQLAAGEEVLGVVWLAIALAVVGQALLAGAWRLVGSMRRQRWPGVAAAAREAARARGDALPERGGRNALLAGVVAALVLAGAVGYAAAGAEVEGQAAGRLVDADSFVDRQWRDFWSPSTYSERGTDRLTTTRGTRSALYGEAWDGFEAAPLRGEGAGAFEVRWMREREVPEKVRDAHSLYLETLSELGLVGLGLLLLFVGAVAVGAARAMRRPRAVRRAQAGAAAAALAAWVAHAGVDWDWQVPALTGVALVLAAVLCAPGRGQRRRATAP